MEQRCFLVVIVVLIALLFPSFTKSDVVNDRYSNTKEHEFLTKDIGYNFLHAYRTTLKKGLPGIEEDVSKGVTLQCWNKIVKLRNDTELLMQYIDAVGKPRSGLLRGNIVWLGSYGECRDIPNAHYCTTELGISVSKSISPKIPKLGALWGLCFPSSCTAQDVDLFLGSILKEVEAFTKNQLLFQYRNLQCPANKPTYTTGVKVTIAFCGVILLLCLIGTVIDYLDEAFSIPPLPKDTSDVGMNGRNLRMGRRSIDITHSVEVDGGDRAGNLTADTVVLLNRESFSVKAHFIILTLKDTFLGRFFQCFSVLQNTTRIFKTDVTPYAVKSINGIRVFSITWVILGHTLASFCSPVTENRAAIVKDGQLLSMMPILNGTYSVDSFFFLSGLLVAYTCFRKLQKDDGKFNWVLFYVHRFWRLTPSYMFVILFSVYLKGFLTESPFWYTQFHDPSCSDHWWTNLLYINNFYPDSGNSQCIGWSWYLANDMQFFVITPFLIYPLFKVGWRGLVLPLGLLLEAFAITAFIHAYWNLDPLDLLKFYQGILNPAALAGSSQSEYMTYVYFKPYCRIQPYLVGFLLGYLMHRYSNTKIRAPGWIITLLGWSVALVLAMLLVYGPHKSILPGAEEWNDVEKVLYGTFHRFLWGVVLAWVTYACHYGAGGLVQKFLSANFWIPLSRLTYNVYLIHLIILALMLYGIQGTIHYDLYTVTYYFLAAVVLSYGAAYILSVCIEFPCANLEELILSYIRKARKKEY